MYIGTVFRLNSRCMETADKNSIMEPKTYPIENLPLHNIWHY